MRWRIDDGTRPWHYWFAWYPVSINNIMVWLETVERHTDNCQGYICHRYRLL